MSTKYCPNCKTDLNLDKFYKRNKKRKDGSINITTQNICTSCSNIRRKKYYSDNREKEIEIRKIREKKIKSWFINFKKTLSCSSCPESRHYVLEFHHPNNDKEYNVADITQGKHSKRTVMKEVNKCIVLCSNCHKALHYNQATVA